MTFALPRPLAPLPAGRRTLGVPVFGCAGGSSLYAPRGGPRAGGRLRNLFGQAEIRTNALQRQGIEAPAPDLTAGGLTAGGFAIGAWWQPECRVFGRPRSAAPFRASGEAVAPPRQPPPARRAT